MYNILICDDEKDIVNALGIYLTNPEYNIIKAYDGAQAVDIVKNTDIQLVLLDIMMPVMDGIVAMKNIREFSNVPIILLTAKSEDSDKILGLNIGADDYITKPFNPAEVVARVQSAIRRYTRLGSSSPKENILKCGGIELDNKSKKVIADGNQVGLTPKEFDILKLFLEEPNTVFSPKDIYSKVWGEEAFGTDANTVAVHIRHLREKIEIDPNNPRYIKVVFGQGYILENAGD